MYNVEQSWSIWDIIEKKIEGIIQQDCLEIIGEIIYIEALFFLNFKNNLVNKCNDRFGSIVLKSGRKLFFLKFCASFYSKWHSFLFFGIALLAFTYLFKKDCD